MTRTPLVLLCSLWVGVPLMAAAQTPDAPAPQGASPAPGQGTGAPTGAAQPPASPDAGPFGTPNAPAPAPQAATPPAAPPPTPAASATPPQAGKTAARPRPATGSLRNGSPTPPAASTGTVSQPGVPSTVTYGGPQPDLQPVYGSPVRDPGAGRDGTAVYNNAPALPGGPVNGTANAYAPTQPYGTARPGSATQASRGTSTDATSTYNLQPLGGVPTTRDQFGTFGGRPGYNASGVYNGTAAQSGTGYGYGSAYAPIGRPQGGLLSTNVDATGPLRPYIPLNQSPQGRPNSGYGIPNGSRATHMDARGVQRLD